MCCLASVILFLFLFLKPNPMRKRGASLKLTLALLSTILCEYHVIACNLLVGMTICRQNDGEKQKQKLKE